MMNPNSRYAAEDFNLTVKIPYPAQAPPGFPSASTYASSSSSASPTNASNHENNSNFLNTSQHLLHRDPAPSKLHLAPQPGPYALYNHHLQAARPQSTLGHRYRHDEQHPQQSMLMMRSVSDQCLFEQEEEKKKTTGPIHNDKYKAKLCKNWVQKGMCPYYEKCQFAHGEHEIEKWAKKRIKGSSNNAPMMMMRQNDDISSVVRQLKEMKVRDLDQLMRLVNNEQQQQSGSGMGYVQPQHAASDYNLGLQSVQMRHNSAHVNSNGRMLHRVDTGRSTHSAEMFSFNKNEFRDDYGRKSSMFQTQTSATSSPFEDNLFLDFPEMKLPTATETNRNEMYNNRQSDWFDFDSFRL